MPNMETTNMILAHKPIQTSAPWLLLGGIALTIAATAIDKRINAKLRQRCHSQSPYNTDTN